MVHFHLIFQDKQRALDDPYLLWDPFCCLNVVIPSQLGLLCLILTLGTAIDSSNKITLHREHSNKSRGQTEAFVLSSEGVELEFESCQHQYIDGKTNKRTKKGVLYHKVIKCGEIS